MAGHVVALQPYEPSLSLYLVLRWHETREESVRDKSWKACLFMISNAMPKFEEEDKNSLRIGGASAVFAGSIFNENDIKKVRRFKDVFAGEISVLTEGKREFLINNDTLVKLSWIRAEDYEIISGSIIARFSILAHISFVAYTGVASYPTFKDGMIEIKKDIRSLIVNIKSHYEENDRRWREFFAEGEDNPQNYPPGDPPLKVDLALREDDEIEVEALEKSSI